MFSIAGVNTFKYSTNEGSSINSFMTDVPIIKKPSVKN